MSPGEWVALIATAVFLLLSVVMVIVLIKLCRTLDEATLALHNLRVNSDPLFTGANTTINHLNTQLERVDGITANTQAVTGNVSALTSVFTATLGGPLVKVAAFSYGVNRALKARRKAKAVTDGRHARLARRGRAG
ncbi:MAG TPA: DUF948 domain-containing protein [Actinophytocola sp.]|uniref:DUF948 domain-containing protein n=1 Tax=Actinophytocola sp. TaxID=1872138 RepID=UPI002DBE4A9A|nr:DUF948 domain-containing protein [Actinophytocola sp.]HEU5472837.1 DUF948 domain-containing protein [Actinophytocola sp.]